MAKSESYNVSLNDSIGYLMHVGIVFIVLALSQVLSTFLRFSSINSDDVFSFD